MKICSLSLGTPYGAREHRQRKRNRTEERNVIIITSFPIVSTTIEKKKKGTGFSSEYTFITVNRNYTSEWNDY